MGGAWAGMGHGAHGGMGTRYDAPPRDSQGGKPTPQTPTCPLVVWDARIAIGHSAVPPGCWMEAPRPGERPGLAYPPARLARGGVPLRAPRLLGVRKKWRLFQRPVAPIAIAPRATHPGLSCGFLATRHFACVVHWARHITAP